MTLSDLSISQYVVANNTMFEEMTNLTTYNTGCIRETELMAKFCTDFKVQVFQIYQERFIIGFIILVILIFLRLYLTRAEPSITKNEFYLKHIDGRIDLAIMFLSIMLLWLLLFI